PLRYAEVAAQPVVNIAMPCEYSVTKGFQYGLHTIRLCKLRPLGVPGSALAIEPCQFRIAIDALVGTRIPVRQPEVSCCVRVDFAAFFQSPLKQSFMKNQKRAVKGKEQSAF